MNSRIKQLRKHLDLTLDAFGSKLGVTRGAVSNIENGRSNPSDQLILSICREFRVNEEWRRTGVGEMFLQSTRTQQIADFVSDALAEYPDGDRSVIISTLAQLDPEDWQALARIIRKLRNAP